VREFVDTAFTCVGLDYEKYIRIDPKFFRSTEPVQLCGNPAKIQEKLGWRRTKTLQEIIEEMVANELELNGK
jgi:GDPmannose 4,6-dehydratase